MCGHLGGPAPKAVVIYVNQPSRMHASASQDKNRRKPGHDEGQDPRGGKGKGRSVAEGGSSQGWKSSFLLGAP